MSKGAGDAGHGRELLPSSSEQHTGELWWPLLTWAEGAGALLGLLGGWALTEHRQKVKVQLGIKQSLQPGFHLPGLPSAL